MRLFVEIGELIVFNHRVSQVKRDVITDALFSRWIDGRSMRRAARRSRAKQRYGLYRKSRRKRVAAAL